MVWSELELEYALGFPLIGEVGMVEEPSRVAIDTILEWREPCWEG
jgi:hypothetical protein